MINIHKKRNDEIRTKWELGRKWIQYSTTEGNGYSTVQLKNEGMNGNNRKNYGRNGYSWKIMEGMDTTEYEGRNKYNWKMREGMDTTEYEGRNKYNWKMREGLDTKEYEGRNGYKRI